MGSAKVYKVKTTRTQRLLRAIKSALDVRAFGHAIKILNYYNYTHVAELRKVTKGPGFRISPTASFSNGQNIVLGSKVHVGANVSIWAGPGSGRIILGDDVLIAPNVMITAANYRFNDGSPVTDQAMDESDVMIGNDVWIGYGAVILPGARIGDGAIIGAGAIVRGKIAPRGIAIGSPAKVTSYRNDFLNTTANETQVSEDIDT